jgi:DNA-binding transcriptional MerR regulator
MRHCEFFEAVRKAGVHGTFNMFRYCRDRGIVDPTPRNAAGERDFTPRQLEQFIRYCRARQSYRATRELLQGSST